MGSSKKIVNGVFWTYILNIVNAIYNFIAVPILINYFGKTEYGLIGLAMSVNVYLRLMDMGFSSTNVRFFSTWLSDNNKEKVYKAFCTSLSFYGIIGLINGIALLILSFFTDSIFNVTPEQSEILRVLIYILAFSAFCHWFSSCFDQLIKATEHVAWIKRRQLIPKVFQILVLIATVYIGFSLEIYFLLTSLATLLIVPLSVSKIRKILPYISFMPKLDKKAFMEMLPYSLNIFSFSIFQFSFYHLRPVFLGIEGSLESVTDFRVMNGIIGVVHMLGGAFLPVLLPSTAKVVAQKNMDAYYRVAYDGTKYISILLCFFSFSFMAMGSDILTLYVGEEYLVLIPWFNMWLLCNLCTHNQAISSLILAGSNIRAITYNTAVASLAGLIVTWLLIPYYQVGGTVLGFVVYFIIQLGFYYLYYWPRKMNISSAKVLLYSFGPYVLIGLIAYFICGVLPNIENHWVNLFFVGGVFSIIYMAGVLLLSNNNDRQFVLRILKRK